MVFLPIKTLDGNDLKFAELLQNIGINRHVARSISYLRTVDEASSSEIEKGADLMQPEVSIAMKTLCGNGWVDERKVRFTGKRGGPMKVYKLSASIERIIEHYEGEKQLQLAKTLNSVKRLRELTSEV